MIRIPLLSRLWNKEPRKPLNLLAPDIFCEGHFHVLANGESKLYVSKLPPDTTPEQLIHVVKCIIDNAIAFGAQHGVKVEVKAQQG